MVSNPNRPFKQADIYVSLFCLFLLFSCSTKDQVVAEVNDKELTKKEAETLMDHLGYADAAREIESAVNADLLARADKKRSTTEIGDALLAQL